MIYPFYLVNVWLVCEMPWWTMALNKYSNTFSTMSQQKTSNILWFFGENYRPYHPQQKHTLGRDASISASGAGDASIAVIQGHKGNFGLECSSRPYEGKPMVNKLISPVGVVRYGGCKCRLTSHKIWWNLETIAELRMEVTRNTNT